MMLAKVASGVGMIKLESHLRIGQCDVAQTNTLCRAGTATFVTSLAMQAPRLVPP